MKKVLLLFLVIVLPIAAYTQGDEKALIEKYCNLLANDLIERTDGYFQNDTLITLEGGGIAKSILIGLPASYNFDLVRMDVRLMTQSYADVNIATLWQPGYDSIYQIGLGLPDNLDGIIYYSMKVKTIIVTITRRTTSN